MTTTAIENDIDTFDAAQNSVRGGQLHGGGILPLDYDALAGTVPAGGNSVTGVAGIASGAAAITLTPGQIGNAVIVDGGISTSASAGVVDSYSLELNTDGSATLTDNNAGNAVTVTGATYFLFDGAAITSAGAYQSLYIVASGVDATLAAMYEAAFQRVPDLPGYEFYADQYGTAALPDLHTAAVYFLNSKEFDSKYPALLTTADHGGPNDAAFVETMYSAILGRAASSAEIAFYVDALAGTLTSSSGTLLPAADRATVFEYFTNSPENQKLVSGWLLNPADGPIVLGAKPALTAASAQTLLATEAASGIVDTQDFASMPNTAAISTGGVSIKGADNSNAYGLAQVVTSAANITIELSSTYNFGGIHGVNETLYGYSGGGSWINASGAQGGTITLAGNGNAIGITNYGGTGASIPLVVDGWNSTDGIGLSHNASNILNNDGTFYTASPSAPIYQANLTGNGVVINVGPITATTSSAQTAAMVAAANSDLVVGGDSTAYQGAYFIAQNGANTLVYHWQGDSTGSGHVLASDFDGAAILIGVQADSLGKSNFH